jgi:hypothetical protein
MSAHAVLTGDGISMSRRGHAAKRKVRFMPTEPLKPEEVTIPLRTPKCPFCGNSDVVSLTREEFRALNDPDIDDADALPTRSQPFREHVMSGIHPDCAEKNKKRLTSSEKV